MISFAKKFLSIALALILLVGVFPAAAFAAADEPEQVTVNFWKEQGRKTQVYTTTVDRGGRLSAQELQDALNGANAAADKGMVSDNQWHLCNNTGDVDGNYNFWLEGPYNVYCGYNAKKTFTLTVKTIINGTSTVVGTKTVPMYEGDPVTQDLITSNASYDADRYKYFGFKFGNHSSGQGIHANDAAEVYVTYKALNPIVTVMVKYVDENGKELKTVSDHYNPAASGEKPEVLSKSTIEKFLTDKKTGDEVTYTFSGIDGFGEDILRDCVVNVLVKTKAVAPETDNTTTAQHTIKYYDADGKHIDSWDQKVNHDSVLTAIQIPTDSDAGVKAKVGDNEFVGWEYIKGSGSGIAKLGQHVTKDLHLQLKVNKKSEQPQVSNKVTIKYYDANNNYVAGWDQHKDPGFLLTYSQIPDASNAGVKELVGNATFVGWYYIDHTGSGKAEIGDKVDHDIHLKLVVESKKDTVVDDNGISYDVTFHFGKPNRFKDIVVPLKNDQRIASAEKLGGKLPQRSTDKEILVKWVDADGNEINNETVYKVNKHGRDFYAVWKDAAVVTVKYYVNNNFDRVAYECNLPFVAVGENYDVTPEALLKLYKGGYHNAKRLDGPYDSDGWDRYERNYRHPSKANGTFDVIHGAGSPESATETVLYCMVFDSGYNPNSKPDASNPKTGDNSMIYATTAVMLISAGALAVFFMDRKRRNG